MYEAPKFLAAGDRAIVIELGDEISIECNRRVHTLHRDIVRERLPEVVDIIPTYRSILVEYDATMVSFADMRERLADIRGRRRRNPWRRMRRSSDLPVLYGGEHGPDLEFRRP